MVKGQISQLKENIEAELKNLPGKIGLVSKESIKLRESFSADTGFSNP